VSEFLTLADEDDGKLFRVRVINTGEERIARYHRFTLRRPLHLSRYAPSGSLTRAWASLQPDRQPTPYVPLSSLARSDRPLPVRNAETC
jgi:hypothetical protein